MKIYNVGQNEGMQDYVLYTEVLIVLVFGLGDIALRRETTALRMGLNR